MENIDRHHTYTDDIVETFQVLGIEAARKAIEREIQNVISYDGSYVNQRHLALLCDIMTIKGYLVSTNRHGINRQDISPIMRSTFEETVGVLVDAAAHSETDLLKGVSENILLGQLAKMGTGSFDILLDVEKCTSAMELPTDDIDPFSNMMSFDAKEQYKNRNTISSTPWINQMSTTPSYEYQYSLTTSQMTPKKSENASSAYSFDYSAYSRYISFILFIILMNYFCSVTSPSYSSTSNPFSPTYSVKSDYSISPYCSGQSPPLRTSNYPTSPYYTKQSPSLSNSNHPTSPRYTTSTKLVYFCLFSFVYTTFHNLFSPSYAPTSPFIPRKIDVLFVLGINIIYIEYF